MKIIHYIGIIFLISEFVNSEKVYEWDVITFPQQIQLGDHHWRPTSFAVTKDSIFMTLIDVENVKGSGIVGWFNKTSEKSPAAKIYPTPSIYRMVDARFGRRIISPFAVRTDSCNRIWILDSGVQNISGTQRRENPSIFIFDLSNGKLIRNYPLPKEQWNSKSFFVNFVIDSGRNCEDVFAYLADFNTFRLVTYDFMKNESYVKKHHFFSPDPLIFTPDEVIYNKQDQDLNGIFGLALVKQPSYGELYLHPLASFNEFSVRTDDLKNDKPLKYTDVMVLESRNSVTPSGFSAYDEDTDNLFFSEINTRKVGCLNLGYLNTDESISSVYHQLDMKIPQGFIVDLNVVDSEMWVLVHHNSIISVYKENILELIKGTSCDASSGLKPRSGNSANYMKSSVLILFITITSFLLIV